MSDRNFDADATLSSARKVTDKSEDKAISKQEVKDALVSFAADILHSSGIGLETFIKDAEQVNKEEVLQDKQSDFQGKTSELLEGLKKFAKARYVLEKLGKPSYLEGMLPDVSKDLSLTTFPIPFKLPMAEMSKKIGAEETLEFVHGAITALEPVVVKKINEQFKRKYPDMSQDLVGKIFVSEANFSFKLLELNQEAGTVKLLETMFNDRLNVYEETEFEEQMHISTFQKEFTILNG